MHSTIQLGSLSMLVIGECSDNNKLKYDQRQIHKLCVAK